MIEQRLEGRVLIATLNRPDAANGIDPSMAAALEALAGRLRQGEDVDAVVLTGKGRVFCAGGDVGAFKSALGSSDPVALPNLLNELATRVHKALAELMDAGPLLIGAINGPATGAGLGLVAACDIAYARSSATLRAGFSKLGLSPDTGTSYFLPRRIGFRAALSVLLRGDAVSAERAQQLGLFEELIEGDDDAFVAAVVARAQALIACGAAARTTRALLREGLQTTSLDAHLQREQDALVHLASTPAVGAQLRKTLGLN